MSSTPHRSAVRSEVSSIIAGETAEAGIPAQLGALGGTHVLDAFRYRIFQLFWVSQFARSASFWGETVARNWLVWDLTGSALMLGWLNLTQSVPGIVLGPLGGVMADRFNRKLILVFAQSALLLCYGTMALLLLAGAVQVWHLFVVAAAMGLIGAVEMSTRQSLLPRLVPDSTLLNAVSMNQVAVNISRIFGPAASGLLLAGVGAKGAYIAAFFILLISISAISSIRIPRDDSGTQRAPVFKSLLEGLRYMARGNPDIRVVMLMAFVVILFGMTYNTMMPVIAANIFGLGPSGYGTLLTITGVGALAASFTMAFKGEVQHGGLTLMVAGLVLLACVVGVSISPSVVLGGALFLIIGGAQALVFAMANTLLLRLSPPEMQGRVMSIFMLDWALIPLGATMAGFIADAAGIRVALLAVALLGLVVVGTVSLLSPRVRKL